MAAGNIVSKYGGKPSELPRCNHKLKTAGKLGGILLSEFLLAAGIASAQLSPHELKPGQLSQERDHGSANLVVARSGYFLGEGAVPGHREVDFRTFDNLPVAYRQILERSDKVLGFEGISGEQLYIALPAAKRAAFLNIAAKMDALMLPIPGHDQRVSMLTSLREIDEFREDRFFGVIESGLKEQVRLGTEARLLYIRTRASSCLHHSERGFTKFGSFKTYDKSGNLDVTLSERSGAWRIEADIDKWQGPVHLFREVAYNHLFHRLTNPYEVFAILVTKQKIDPLYIIRRPETLLNPLPAVARLTASKIQ